MNEFIKNLRSHLVGKLITSINPPTISESHFSIETSDGNHIHICANELGAWIIGGKNATGTYNNIGALSYAVETYRNNNIIINNASAKKDNDRIIINAGDGTEFILDISKMQDDWEKSIVTHPQVTTFLGRVVEDYVFWESWFNSNKKNGYDPWINGDRSIIPNELKKAFQFRD